MTRYLPKCFRFNARMTATLLGAVLGAALLAGCAPTYSTRPGGGYYNGGQPAYGNSGRCFQGCGYVRDIRQVWLDRGNHDAAVLGTVIGAVIGGALGHQVGGGNGKKAATVAGAVAGGIAGHAIGENAGNSHPAWQISVQMRDGQYATVTQREQPRVRQGDYVYIRNNVVYRY